MPDNFRGLERPDVDKIDDFLLLSNWTKDHQQSPSTVGTITEIYDFPLCFMHVPRMPIVSTQREKMVSYSDEQIKL
jgi:excinuclease UvrABC ATPase subunit